MNSAPPYSTVRMAIYAGDFLKKVKDGIEFNDHIENAPGHVIFEHACKLGHEGIIAKRKDLPYESGRSKRSLKIKNPASPAMKRVEDGTF
jgi:ATP-dependent DNA ligase